MYTGYALYGTGSRPAATSHWYCGSGVNAATDGFLITRAPVLGDALTAAVSDGQPLSSIAMLAGYAAPLTLAHPLGEILVDVTHPGGELLGFPIAVGTPPVFHLPVSDVAALAGQQVYVQAASFGSVNRLHCAYQCTVGF